MWSAGCGGFLWWQQRKKWTNDINTEMFSPYIPWNASSIKKNLTIKLGIETKTSFSECNDIITEPSGRKNDIMNYLNLSLYPFKDQLDFEIFCVSPSKFLQLQLTTLLFYGTKGCEQESFKLVWRCHQLLSGFLAKGHLPRVLRQSRRSLMIRVIMKWLRGLCTDVLAFAL